MRGGPAGAPRRPLFCVSERDFCMGDTSDITGESLVDEVMTSFPPTIPVFLRRRMSCVGCLMGTFHTVAEAAEEYRIPPDDLVAELRGAAAAAGFDLEQRLASCRAEDGLDTKGGCQ
jgi:hybrid cluster-associated redox disulfide protein